MGWAPSMRAAELDGGPGRALRTAQRGHSKPYTPTNAKQTSGTTKPRDMSDLIRDVAHQLRHERPAHDRHDDERRCLFRPAAQAVDMPSAKIVGNMIDMKKVAQEHAAHRQPAELAGKSRRHTTALIIPYKTQHPVRREFFQETRAGEAS